MDNELMNYPRESSSYSVTVYALGGRKEKKRKEEGFETAFERRKCCSFLKEESVVALCVTQEAE